MRTFDLSPVLRRWIGFDEITSALENLSQYQTFPTYNIKKTDDNHYQIVLALAGFKQSDLNIEQRGSQLIVQGKSNETEEEKKPHYIHQGLIHNAFELQFTLADYMRPDNASFKDGLLQIDLIREVPEALLPQQITIH